MPPALLGAMAWPCLQLPRRTASVCVLRRCPAPPTVAPASRHRLHARGAAPAPAPGPAARRCNTYVTAVPTGGQQQPSSAEDASVAPVLDTVEASLQRLGDLNGKLGSLSSSKLESLDAQLAALDAQVAEARAALLAASRKTASAPQRTSATQQGASTSSAAAQTSRPAEYADVEVRAFLDASILTAARMLSDATPARRPVLWAALSYSSAAALGAYLRATGRGALLTGLPEPKPEVGGVSFAAVAPLPPLPAAVPLPAPAVVTRSEPVAAVVEAPPVPKAAAPPANWGSAAWAASLVRSDTADVSPRVLPTRQQAAPVVVTAPPTPAAVEDQSPTTVQSDPAWAARVVNEDTASIIRKRTDRVRDAAKAAMDAAAAAAELQKRREAKALALQEVEALAAERRAAAIAADAAYRAQRAAEVAAAPAAPKKRVAKKAPAQMTSTTEAVQEAPLASDAAPAPKKRVPRKTSKTGAVAEVLDAGVRPVGDADLVAKLAKADALAAAASAAQVTADAIAHMNAAGAEYSAAVAAEAKLAPKSKKKSPSKPRAKKTKEPSAEEVAAAAEVVAIAASVKEQAEQEAPAAMQGTAGLSDAPVSQAVVASTQKTAFIRFTKAHGGKKKGHGPGHAPSAGGKGGKKPQSSQ